MTVGLIVNDMSVGIFGNLGFPKGSSPPTASTSATTGLLHWDADIYQRIIIHGYQTSYPDATSFFPLYPVSVRALTEVLPFGPAAVALGVTWLGLWMACWGVMRLSSVIFPGSAPWRAAALMAFFPASVFLIAGYPESIFVALVAWTMVAALEGRHWTAALFAGLASATRPEGAFLLVVVAGPPAWEVIRDAVSGAGVAIGRIGRVVALALTSITGFLGFTAFMWIHYGSPTEEFKVQADWHRIRTLPMQPVIRSLNQVVFGPLNPKTRANTIAVFLLDDVTVLVAIGAVMVLALIAQRQPRLWWAVGFLAADLLLIVSNGPWGSTPEAASRLIMCLAPLYCLTARIRNEAVWTSLLAGSAVLATMFQVIFNTGSWFT